MNEQQRFDGSSTASNLRRGEAGLTPPRRPVSADGQTHDQLLHHVVEPTFSVLHLAGRPAAKVSLEMALQQGIRVQASHLSLAQLPGARSATLLTLQRGGSHENNVVRRQQLRGPVTSGLVAVQIQAIDHARVAHRRRPPTWPPQTDATLGGMLAPFEAKGFPVRVVCADEPIPLIAVRSLLSRATPRHGSISATTTAALAAAATPPTSPPKAGR